MSRIERDVNWVELGCRGWDIDEAGAGLAQGNRHQDGDPTVCCDDDCCHLDEETLELAFNGCPDFLRRVMDDLGAARHPAFSLWAITNGTTGAPITGTVTGTYWTSSFPGLSP